MVLKNSTGFAFNPGHTRKVNLQYEEDMPSDGNFIYPWGSPLKFCLVHMWLLVFNNTLSESYDLFYTLSDQSIQIQGIEVYLLSKQFQTMYLLLYCFTAKLLESSASYVPCFSCQTGRRILDCHIDIEDSRRAFVFPFLLWIMIPCYSPRPKSG